MAGDVLLPSGRGYQFLLGPLTDSRLLLFVVGTASGTGPEYLFHFRDGKFTLLAGPGTDGPLGPWPETFGVAWPIGMNQSGDVVFTAVRIPGTIVGTFLWSSRLQKVEMIAVTGTPAVGGFLFAQAGSFSPAINNLGEVALSGAMRNGFGTTGPGIYLREPSGSFLPVLRPRQVLPGGGILASLGTPHLSVNDAGSVAFIGPRPGHTGRAAFLWERGPFSILLSPGAAVPGGQVDSVLGVQLNNRDRSALLTVELTGSSNPCGLYRVLGGTVSAVATPGQEMPGGAKLRTAITVSGLAHMSLSPASGSGEHVFHARLDDGTTATYRIDAAGKLALVLKKGTTTEWGTISRVVGECPPAINSAGEIALVVQFDGGPHTLVLLTPETP